MRRRPRARVVSTLWRCLKVCRTEVGRKSRRESGTRQTKERIWCGVVKEADYGRLVC